MITYLDLHQGRKQPFKRIAANIANALLFISVITFAASIAAAQKPRVPTPGADGSFSDFQVDGDRMKVKRRELGRNDSDFYYSSIRIKLEADSSWWKMIRVYTYDGSAYNLEQQNGRYKLTFSHPYYPLRPVQDMTSAVNRETHINSSTMSFGETIRVEYWKAKLLGVHTHVATEIYRTEDFEGWETTFNWRDGLEDGYSDGYEDATEPIDMAFTIDRTNVKIVSSDGGSPDHATIKFNTDVAWWTALKTFERSGKAWLIQKSEGKYDPATRTIRLPISSLPAEVKLEFWTAKMLGIRTNMATRKIIRERFAGRVVTIDWGTPAAAIDDKVAIDGKNVTIKSADNGTIGQVKIIFQTGKEWWTALKFFDSAGKAWTIEKANGKYRPATRVYTFPISKLPPTVNFELWTAKAFGVHTHMRTRSYPRERLEGRTITINWPK